MHKHGPTFFGYDVERRVDDVVEFQIALGFIKAFNIQWVILQIGGVNTECARKRGT